MQQLTNQVESTAVKLVFKKYRYIKKSFKSNGVLL